MQQVRIFDMFSKSSTSKLFATSEFCLVLKQKLEKCVLLTCFKKQKQALKHFLQATESIPTQYMKIDYQTYRSILYRKWHIEGEGESLPWWFTLYRGNPALICSEPSCSSVSCCSSCQWGRIFNLLTNRTFQPVSSPVQPSKKLCRKTSQCIVSLLISPDIFSVPSLCEMWFIRATFYPSHSQLV